MTFFVSSMKAVHPLEVALATQARAALALLRQDAVEHELRGDAGMVEARQEQRRSPEHAGVADHQVLDRRPLGVAQVEAAGDVRRRLDDHERLERPIRRGARAIRREDVGRQPSLVDVVLELRWRVGLRERLWRLFCGHRMLRFRPGSWPGNNDAPSSSGRTGSWYHLLVWLRDPRRSSRPGPSRGSLRRAIGRHPHGSRATFGPAYPRGSHRPALAWGRSRTYSSRSPP